MKENRGEYFSLQLFARLLYLSLYIIVVIIIGDEYPFPNPHRYAKRINIICDGNCDTNAPLRTFAVHITYPVGIGVRTPNSDALSDSRD